MRLKLRSLVVVSIMALLATGLLAAPAQGATITVDVTHDDPIANLDSEVIPDGDCSLREAIFAADNDVAVDTCVAGDGPDTIVLDSNETYTLDVNSPTLEEDLDRRGDLDIYNGGIIERFNEESFSAIEPPEFPDLTIEGNGSTVDGSGLLHCNVFHIIDASVVINSLTITGAGVQTPPPEGGGFLVEGGSLYLTNSTVTNNIADNGAGIYNAGGHVEITGGSVIGPGNDANENGGGIWTGFGQESLVIQDSTVTGNDAAWSGGGIYNVDDSLTIDRSAISDNTALDGDGGGIWTTGSGLNVTNTTISGNAAEEVFAESGHAQGGGIYLEGSGQFELHFVTLADNVADFRGGNIAIGNGPLPAGTGNLDNTILTGGMGGFTEDNCFVNEGDDIASFGFNLSDLAQDADPAGANSCRLDDASDLVGQDPELGPLQNNGGPTETHALPPTSPAVDSAGVTCVATDQRGVSRPQNGDGDGPAPCDRGAFELEGPTGGGGLEQVPPSPPATCAITGTSDADLLVGTDSGETICGLQGDDTIRGAGGTDTLFGDEGDDLLEGGPGDDAIVGGPGSDTATYANAPGSVDADLARGTAVGVGASTDTLSGVENLIGSRFPDILRGDGGSNVLIGGDAADLVVGRAGEDLLRGKAGDDTLLGKAGRDRVKGGGDRDRAKGGKDNDRVGGGSGDDRVLGNLGSDFLRGWAGDDYLNGQRGNDTCDGGLGTNQLVNCEQEAVGKV